MAEKVGRLGMSNVGKMVEYTKRVHASYESSDATSTGSGFSQSNPASRLTESPPPLDGQTFESNLRSLTFKSNEVGAEGASVGAFNTRLPFLQRGGNVNHSGESQTWQESDFTRGYDPSTLPNLNASLGADIEECGLSEDYTGEAVESSAILGCESTSLEEVKNVCEVIALSLDCSKTAEPAALAVEDLVDDAVIPRSGVVIVSAAPKSIDSGVDRSYQPQQQALHMIKIFNFHGDPYEALARIDTCADINMISSAQIEKMDEVNNIKEYEGEEPQIGMADGSKLKLRGSITLTWIMPTGINRHQVCFHVVDNLPYDVIFGEGYTKSKKLVHFNWGAALPTVIHRRLPEAERADHKAKLQQAKAKADLEEKKQRKRKEDAAKETQKGQEKEASQDTG